MDRYIIKERMLLNGKMVTTYHEKLVLSTRTDTTNAYTSHSISDRSKALIFYDKDEADRMAAFLTRSYSKPTVIKK